MVQFILLPEYIDPKKVRKKERKEERKEERKIDLYIRHRPGASRLRQVGVSKTRQVT
jgi:hypothetical protein